ncbi:carboxypeptidase-like regulatory domain-containing protein [Mucilaginibacter sp. PAMB04168]|uniref:carboxypeptidase-like regulatory domain-containing protein n=1 Tax=Mucilaginibacter sp. PAMB04168 TaxID=3138567 RepID=UPI0031F67BE3
MKSLLPLLLVFIACFYSCKKKDSPTATAGTSGVTSPATGNAPATGSVIGVISPAGAATEVSVSDGSKFYRKVQPDASGVFRFADLPAGTYTLLPFASAGYALLGSQTLTVTAGQITDVGTLTFSAAVGSITGFIAPVGAVVKITATNTTSKFSYDVTPDATTGAYKFNGVVPGPYIIHFTAAAPSIAPADLDRTVPGNQDTYLNKVILETPNVTGIMSGTIVPAGTAKVNLTNEQTRDLVYIDPDISTGKFVSPALLPGTYTVGFNIIDRNRRSPNKLTVSIAPGQKSDLGEIKIPLYLHTLNCLVNGVRFSGVTVVSCNYNAPTLTMGASNSGGFDNAMTSLRINLDNITGVGSYTIQNTPTSNITYSTGTLGYKHWGSNNGGSGTVTVTSIDPVLKIISGTFTATLLPIGNLTGNVVITDGVFNLTY